MKKMITLAAIFISATLTAFRAEAGDNVNSRVLEQFKKEFSEATDIKWSVTNEIVKANFNYHNARTEAYFTTDGQLIGTARSILFSQLPIAVAKEVEKKYAATTVYEIVEYYVNGETQYSMIVDLGKNKLKIKSTAGGNTWVEKKLRK